MAEIDDVIGYLVDNSFSWISPDSTTESSGLTTALLDKVSSSPPTYSNAKSINPTHAFRQSNPTNQPPEPAPSALIGGNEIIAFNQASWLDSDLTADDWVFSNNGSGFMVAHFFIPKTLSSRNWLFTHPGATYFETGFNFLVNAGQLQARVSRNQAAPAVNTGLQSNVVIDTPLYSIFGYNESAATKALFLKNQTPLPIGSYNGSPSTSSPAATMRLGASSTGTNPAQGHWFDTIFLNRTDYNWASYVHRYAYLKYGLGSPSLGALGATSTVYSIPKITSAVASLATVAAASVVAYTSDIIANSTISASPKATSGQTYVGSFSFSPDLRSDFSSNLDVESTPSLGVQISSTLDIQAAVNPSSNFSGTSLISSTPFAGVDIVGFALVEAAADDIGYEGSIEGSTLLFGSPSYASNISATSAVSALLSSRVAISSTLDVQTAPYEQITVPMPSATATVLATPYFSTSISGSSNFQSSPSLDYASSFSSSATFESSPNYGSNIAASSNISVAGSGSAGIITSEFSISGSPSYRGAISGTGRLQSSGLKRGFQDYAYNLLQLPAAVSFLGWSTPQEIQEQLNLDPYLFLIEGIRIEDQQNGLYSLKRFISGYKTFWSNQQKSIFELKDLQNISKIKDKYIHNQMPLYGWTKEFDKITKNVDYQVLRRLMASSISIWKSRGTESGLVNIIGIVTKNKSRILNWFHYRWVIGETELSHYDEFGDPWTISERDSYLYNLRIVDDGTLNKSVIRELCKLMRPFGERIDITYLMFMDNGENTDPDQWTHGQGGAKIANVPGSSSWKNYVLVCKMKCSEEIGWGVTFMQLDESNKYAFICYDYNVWALIKYVNNVQETLSFNEGPKIYKNTYYEIRIQVFEQNGQNSIICYVDGIEVINAIDSSHVSGTVGVTTIYPLSNFIETDHFEIIGLPSETDIIDLES